MKTKAASFRLFVLLALALAATAGAAAAAPETTEDGLVLVKKSKADAVYRRPGVAFSDYTKVTLLEPLIAFQKDWQEKHNRENWRNQISDADMATMIAKGKELLKEEFTAVLNKKGYPVVAGSGKDVLGIRVLVLNLDVAAPDPNNAVGSFTKVYTEGAGSATLVVELYDSVTWQVIARAFDHKMDQGTGHAGASERDHQTNVADASYAFHSWAQQLVKGLERAKQSEADGK